MSSNTKLFVEIYTDEDVDILVAELLRARGFEVQTTRDAGNLGQGDREQFEYAVRNGYAIFTHNRSDFEALAAEYFATGKEHFGVIIAVRHPPHEIARRLLIILNQSTSDEMANQLIYI